MAFFQEVEGEAAVLVNNGVYRQCPIFKRDGYLYAKTSGGFVRLYADGSTSQAKVRLEFMSWDGPLAKDGMGKLCSPDVKGMKLLGTDAKILLGQP